MLEDLAEHATLCYRMGAGHGTWIKKDTFGGDTVAAINQYLLELEAPDDGTTFQS